MVFLSSHSDLSPSDLNHEAMPVPYRHGKRTTGATLLSASSCSFGPRARGQTENRTSGTRLVQMVASMSRDQTQQDGLTVEVIERMLLETTHASFRGCQEMQGRAQSTRTRPPWRCKVRPPPPFPSFRTPLPFSAFSPNGFHPSLGASADLTGIMLRGLVERHGGCRGRVGNAHQRHKVCNSEQLPLGCRG